MAFHAIFTMWRQIIVVAESWKRRPSLGIAPQPWKMGLGKTLSSWANFSKRTRDAPSIAIGTTQRNDYSTYHILMKHWGEHGVPVFLS
jgi:hypothetical protein